MLVFILDFFKITVIIDNVEVVFHTNNNFNLMAMERYLVNSSYFKEGIRSSEPIVPKYYTIIWDCTLSLKEITDIFIKICGENSWVLQDS